MTTHSLSLPGGTIAYELTGPADGRLVVLSHGMGVTRATFRFLVADLAAAGYRVANMDVRGYGESSLGWPGYGTTQTSQDILALIRHLGGPAIVIGHSFSGGAAALATIESPELVAKLVLMHPSIRQQKMSAVMGFIAKQATNRAGLWMMVHKSFFPAAKPADFDEYRSALRSSLRRKGRMAAVRGLIDSFPTETPADLSKVTTPALVIMGCHKSDKTNPAAEAERIGSELAGPATVKILDDSGHYPHEDNAHTVSAAVLTFLKEN